jgi:hypothetical protein
VLPLLQGQLSFHQNLYHKKAKQEARLELEADIEKYEAV